MEHEDDSFEEEEYEEYEDDTLEEVTVRPGLQLPKGLAEVWPQIEPTEKTSIKITATPVDTPANRPNSFGCYPTLPRGFAYPRDAKGNFMFPLAQIHCADLPPLPGYPDKGYLQFYIAVEDDLYGLDFNDRITQTGFRVLYFEENEIADPETEFGFLKEILRSFGPPVSKPYTLSFSLQQDYLGLHEAGRREQISFLETFEEKHPLYAEELEDELYRRFSAGGHKIGGYFYTTQHDPRDEDQMDWVLLFQMDTDGDIMWGDAGVANFFIHPDRLQAKDFSTVLYNWDCH